MSARERAPRRAITLQVKTNVTLFRVVLLSFRDESSGWAWPGRADPVFCGAVLAGDPRLLLAAVFVSDPGLCEFQSIGDDDDAIANSSHRINYLGVVAARASADKELLRDTCSQTSNCLAYRSAMCWDINSPPNPRYCRTTNQNDYTQRFHAHSHKSTHTPLLNFICFQGL